LQIKEGKPCFSSIVGGIQIQIFTLCIAREPTIADDTSIGGGIDTYFQPSCSAYTFINSWREEETQEMEERVKAQEEQKRLEVRAALEEQLNIEMHCRLLEERRLAKEKLAAE
jgi:hypothetical protein